MNLKFLRSITEDHDKSMSTAEMKTYLDLLYKKCNKKAKNEFKEYLKTQCNVDDADFVKCSDSICNDAKNCDKIIHHLEKLSNKIDENSLSMILKNGKTT